MKMELPLKSNFQPTTFLHLFNQLNMKFFRFCLLALSLSVSCTAQTPIHELRLGTKLVRLLDSTSAAKYITFDQRDQYFERVTAAEMSIQMKKALQPGQTRADILPAYIEFLKKDVENFSAAESKFTATAIEKVYRTVTEIDKNIFPDTLIIIKTKGRHYGDGVYYTRENCIIIPANELSAAKTNPFTTTMYHELFHVYSRLHPAKRAKLYQLIGFKTIGLDHLDMPASLSERVLYNPDGVDFAQKIDLTLADGSKISAIPIIYAKNPGYKPGIEEFFGYLEFNLFQIEPVANNRYKVVVKEDGYSSVLNLESLTDFFKQIRDNTGYIIHPDEVLADNFSFIMVDKNGSKVSARFSPAGKQLLTDIEFILKEK
jgi:hypothetical protein